MIVIMIGLALQAGGVKGFSHIATLKVFEECKTKPDIISGSSAGAIVGALYALHNDSDVVYKAFSDAVRKFLKKQKSKPEPIMNFEMVIKESLYSLDEYYQFFKALFGKRKFSELKTKLLVVAFDIESWKSFIIDEGYVVDAVLASCTVPGVFEPTYIAGVRMLDGGVLSPVPTFELKQYGVDKIVASIFKESVPSYTTHMELMLTIDAIKESYIIQHELSIADFVFSYPVNVNWQDFNKYAEVYENALNVARRVKDEFENFIRR
ncbi:patatin-like phospholipase family protein [Fervidobacterium changbaicum]|nr:patatin-like phospholipase family protein [Fervidobacterium changbaicum]